MSKRNIELNAVNWGVWKLRDSISRNEAAPTERPPTSIVSLSAVYDGWHGWCQPSAVLILEWRLTSLQWGFLITANFCQPSARKAEDTMPPTTNTLHCACGTNTSRPECSTSLGPIECPCVAEHLTDDNNHTSGHSASVVLVEQKNKNIENNNFLHYEKQMRVVIWEPSWGGYWTSIYKGKKLQNFDDCQVSQLEAQKDFLTLFFFLHL